MFSDAVKDLFTSKRCCKYVQHQRQLTNRKYTDYLTMFSGQKVPVDSFLTVINSPSFRDNSKECLHESRVASHSRRTLSTSSLCVDCICTEIVIHSAVWRKEADHLELIWIHPPRETVFSWLLLHFEIEKKKSPDFFSVSEKNWRSF